MKKKFLILTADAGFGHRSASNAVVKALEVLYGNQCECKIVNPAYEHSAPIFLRKPQLNYDKTVKNEAFYNFTYQISDKKFTAIIVNEAVAVFLYQTMFRLIMDYQPDAILSTYFFYPTPIKTILDVLHFRIPCFTIVTDLANVHKFWFQQSKEILFVPTEGVRREAIAFGFPENKIYVSGIPVSPSIFLEQRSKKEIRKDLGWNPDLKTILIVSSRRVNHILERVEMIDASELPIQLIVVTGGDDSAFLELKQRQWRHAIHVYNYVENVPEMMRAADILISKAGGLIISEGLACGLPILLIDALPGQETGNVSFVCQNRVGVRVNSTQEMLETLQSWFSNQEALLKEYSQNAAKIGKPDAALKIAKIAWDSAQKNTLQSSNKYQSMVVTD